jgi:hypothetical protein
MKRKKSSSKRWLAVPAGLGLSGVAIYVLLSAPALSPARVSIGQPEPEPPGPRRSEEIDDGSRAQLREILRAADAGEDALP